MAVLGMLQMILRRSRPLPRKAREDRSASPPVAHIPARCAMLGCGTAHTLTPSPKFVGRSQTVALPRQRAVFRSDLELKQHKCVRVGMPLKELFCSAMFPLRGPGSNAGTPCEDITGMFGRQERE